MPEQFLHGVEVIEVSSGPRPIRTVKSSVIGIIGTAPDAAPEVKASFQTTSSAANSALTITSKLTGVLGNRTSIAFIAPNTASATLSVTVSGQAITVNLATSSEKAVTSTAANVIAAIAAKSEAAALVVATNTGSSTGAGVVSAFARATLSGGADEPFPLNTPALIAGSRFEAAKLGATGTLPNAIDGIFDQVGAAIVVVRVEPGEENVIGGVDGANFEGVHAFLGAESVLGVVPRILIAPGFSSEQAVLAEMVGIAQRLRAIVVADGPDTTDAEAISYGGDFGSDRVYLVDPGLKVSRDGFVVIEPSSPRVAGLIAKSDNERGFWWSPSNQEINGIVGTTRPIDYTLGDPNCRANLLNEANITTVIRQNGYRLWGNRTLSADPRFAFLSVRRTADMINDSILRGHLWAVDRNITKTYLKDVSESVNAYLSTLKNEGAILGGRCYPDPDLNSPANISQGKVYFNFEFTPPYPAEHITFKSIIVNDYLEELTK